MKQLSISAGIALGAGLLAFALATSPAMLLLGKLFVAVAIVCVAAAATTYLMMQSFATHLLRNEDFHWPGA